MKILIACEESQVVCKAFRKLGHEAYSCDLQDCSGGHPEWHYKCDVRDLILNGASEQWDRVIAHPPCDFIANSGNKWFYHPSDKHLPITERRAHPLYPNRWQDFEKAITFFKMFVSLGHPDGLLHNGKTKVAIENPIPNKHSRFHIGKYHQIVQPWMFGDGETKATCLWLYGLPKLDPTNIVEGREQKVFRMAPGVDRKKNRSKTYPGIGNAMAEQWS